MEIRDLIQSAVKKQSAAVNDHFEWVIRTYAEPPIKGDITRGKVKWRGLRMCRQNNGLEITYWIEQRGKKIGPSLKLTGNVKT